MEDRPRYHGEKNRCATVKKRTVHVVQQVAGQRIHTRDANSDDPAFKSNCQAQTYNKIYNQNTIPYVAACCADEVAHLGPLRFAHAQ